MMLKQLRPALVSFVLLSAVTGLIYPLVVTGLSKPLFPAEASGSLLRNKAGEVIGSELIGQNFSSPQYFWGRPSATAPMANNAGGSSGSNQGPLNPALTDAVAARVAALRAADPATPRPCRPTSSPLRPAAWIRTSAWPPLATRLRVSLVSASCP